MERSFSGKSGGAHKSRAVGPIAPPPWVSSPSSRPALWHEPPNRLPRAAAGQVPERGWDPAPSQTGAQVQVITAEEIRRHRPADLLALLRSRVYRPGGSRCRSLGCGGSPAGPGQQHVTRSTEPVVILDGARIQRRAAEALSQIGPNQVTRIEIYRGSAGPGSTDSGVQTGSLGSLRCLRAWVRDPSGPRAVWQSIPGRLSKPPTLIVSLPFSRPPRPFAIAPTPPKARGNRHRAAFITNTDPFERRDVNQRIALDSNEVCFHSGTMAPISSSNRRGEAAREVAETRPPWDPGHRSPPCR